MNRYKKRGWFGESHRHYLAAKGISTAKKYNVSKFAQAIGGAAQLRQQSAASRRQRLLSPGELQTAETQLELQKSVRNVPLTDEETDELERRKQEELQQAIAQRDVWRVWTPDIGRDFFEELLDAEEEALRTRDLLRSQLDAAATDAQRKQLMEDLQSAQNELDEIQDKYTEHKKAFDFALSEGTAINLNRYQKGLLREQVAEVRPRLAGLIKAAATRSKKKQRRERRMNE